MELPTCGEKVRRLVLKSPPSMRVFRVDTIRVNVKPDKLNSTLGKGLMADFGGRAETGMHKNGHASTFVTCANGTVDDGPMPGREVDILLCVQ